MIGLSARHWIRLWRAAQGRVHTYRAGWLGLWLKNVRELNHG